MAFGVVEFRVEMKFAVIGLHCVNKKTEAILISENTVFIILSNTSAAFNNLLVVQFYFLQKYNVRIK